MTDGKCELYSRQYAQFVSKEVVKEAAAHIFDDLRATLRAHFEAAGAAVDKAQADKVMEVLSDVECRYYNEFRLQDVFDEVIER
ncbi:MAG: hypothetical protein ACOZEN_10420 [Thermodesulfobacteriota bacterium]